MGWDIVFWTWFAVTVIFSAIMLIGDHLTPSYLFSLQLLTIIGLGLVKLMGKTTLDTVRGIQKTVYDFWLKTSKIEKKPKVKRRILDELS